jgi:hypothetical protein
MKAAVHYRPATHTYFCLDAKWSGSLTRVDYVALWKEGKLPPKTTNIVKVTCPACLREIEAVIGRKLATEVGSS